jgi:hypothetical protein
MIIVLVALSIKILMTVMPLNKSNEAPKSTVYQVRRMFSTLTGLLHKFVIEKRRNSRRVFNIIAGFIHNRGYHLFNTT